MVLGLGLRVQGSGFRVCSLWFRVWELDRVGAYSLVGVGLGFGLLHTVLLGSGLGSGLVHTVFLGRNPRRSFRRSQDLFQERQFQVRQISERD